MLYLSFECLPLIKTVELTLQTITLFFLEEVMKRRKSLQILVPKEKFQKQKKDQVQDLSGKVKVHIEDHGCSGHDLGVIRFADYAESYQIYKATQHEPVIGKKKANYKYDKEALMKQFK